MGTPVSSKNRSASQMGRRRDVADEDIEDNEDENNNENNNNNDHDHDSGSGNEYDSDNDNNAEAHSHDAQDHQQGEEGSRQQAIKARSASSSSTANRGLKHTKTGKIQHKWRKAGVNRRQTAYNRYLQQQSKVLKDCRPDLSPQERMKIIAEAWATSEKNPHKSRRQSPYLLAAIARANEANAAASAAAASTPENSPSWAQSE
ncbi:hypothetical protein DFQ27_009260 [Actinomortierella ambigua]|uniref:Uncharacterized protein n=1 Tax=Actinomortierella ambigua TaxID=1343610 RepID=A0A9P6QIJ8_9FUNG|nr:hypothetical protein DFQ27_009260 [Actinomortierella ambigua]